MSRFAIKAIRGRAAPVELVLEAADAGEAAGRAASEGYTVLGVRRVAAFARRRGKFPLLLFSQELSVLLDAGVALMAALETLAERGERPEVARVIAALVRSLGEGRSFSQALRDHPAVFPELYVAMVQASEQTGALGDALRRYAEHRARMDGVRRKIVSASVYPLLLLGVGGMVVLFLLFYVVPRFSRVYADRGGDLPLFSKWLVAWGQFAYGYGWLLLPFVIALAAALAYLFGPAGRAGVLARLAWRSPGARSGLRVFYLARFYRSVGMLLTGGIPVRSALEMSARLLPPVLRDGLSGARRGIGEGRSMTRALEENGLATGVALRMMRVGESSGRMGEMLERAAAFHEEEVARWIERFSRLFEPALMTVIGLVIGIIVVLMYMPIFELAGSLQ